MTLEIVLTALLWGFGGMVGASIIKACYAICEMRDAYLERHSNYLVVKDEEWE